MLKIRYCASIEVLENNVFEGLLLVNTVGEALGSTEGMSEGKELDNTLHFPKGTLEGVLVEYVEPDM